MQNRKSSLQAAGLVLNEAAAAPVSALQHFTTNLVGAVRFDQLEGREHVVCPVVMLTHGVHTGSAGPLYYPEDELSRHPQGWDLRPITVYHPEIDGKGVSAANPTILNTQKVGVLLNSQYKSKLRSEAWIDVERANAVDTRVLDSVLNNKVMEVSTGLFTDNEATKGVWNNEPYEAIARNYRPDHLALLPDRIGACSVAKGAGLLQLNEQLETVSRLDPKKVEQVRGLIREMMTANEMSFENIRSGLSAALRSKLGDSWDGWIESVYTGFVIYWQDTKLFRLGYSATDTKVALADDTPDTVVRVTEYRLEKDGSFVGNSLGDTKQKENTAMNRDQQVTSLIANTATKWEESDRAYLVAMPQAQFDKVLNMEVKTPVGQSGDTTTTPAPQQTTVTAAPTGNQLPAQPLSVDQYIAAAPVAIRNMLKGGLAAAQAQKARLIDVIMNNPTNGFTREYLAGIEDVNMLQGMASLCPNLQESINGGGAPMFQPNFAGASLPIGNQEIPESELPILALPTMNFERRTG